MQTGQLGAISQDGGLPPHSLKSISDGFSLRRPHPDFLPVIDSLVLISPVWKLSKEDLNPAWEGELIEIKDKRKKVKNFIIFKPLTLL